MVDMYACKFNDRHMASTLKRKSYFVDERAIRRAKRVLGVATDAEVVRVAVERVAEMERFWKLMEDTRGQLKPGSIGRP
jgi:hypothetical protein